MREIQTKIRRDRIENDNRKTELQSKSQGGLKTAKSEEKDTNQSTENTSAISNIVPEKKKDSITFREQSEGDGVIFSEQTGQPQAENIQIPTDIQTDLEQLKADITLEPTAQSETANSTTEKSKIVHLKSTAAEIQSQIKRDSIDSSIDRSAIQSRSEGGIKTAKAAYATNVSKTDKISKIKENARKGFVRAKRLQTAATVGSAAAGIISAVVPKGDGGDLSTESAGKVKESAGNITVKSFDAVKSFAENKAKTLKAIEKGGIRGKIVRGRIYNLRINISERITENIKPLKFVRDKTRAIKANTVKAVNSLKVVKTVRRLNAIKVEDLVKASRPVKAIQSLKVVKAVKRLNAIRVEDIIKNSKAVKAFNSLKAVKAVKKLNSIKIGNSAKAALKKAENVNSAAGGIGGAAMKGVFSAVNTVQRFKGFSDSGDVGSDLAEQTKDAAGKVVEKTAQLSQKSVQKISKSVKTVKKASKPAKRTLRTASKKAVKTSAKAAEKTAQATAKAAAKTAETSAKISTKIISGIANAVGSLMTSPVGPIVLIVVLAVVLIVIIFNMISGAVQIPATVVSGAGSSLGWLFGDDSRANDDVADIYADFEGLAVMAMSDARTTYKERINNLGLGERDTIVLNGASFYPATAADEFLQSVLDGLNYSDYMYLCEICYILKLREERAAQGLSENDMPKVTITRNDILNFLLDYGFMYDLTVEGGQECPTADCKLREIPPGHCGGYCSPNDDGSPGVCPGHPVPPQPYCDHSHVRAVIVIQEVPRGVIEDDVLMLTEEEKNMIAIALELLSDISQP